MSGSITSRIRSGAPCRFAFEKSVFAAFSNASSNARGVGGGVGGGAVCARAETDESTDPQTMTEARMYRLARDASELAIWFLLLPSIANYPLARGRCAGCFLRNSPHK